MMSLVYDAEQCVLCMGIVRGRIVRGGATAPRNNHLRDRVVDDQADRRRRGRRRLPDRR